MDKNSDAVKIIIKIMIGIGVLCTLLGGIVTLIFGIMDIAVPKFITILFCIGCFVSAGVNLHNYGKIKNQQNGKSKL